MSTDIIEIKYGDRRWEVVGSRITARHVQANQSAQTWSYTEFGVMGNDIYRIDIKHDQSYSTQSSASLRKLNADWVTVALLFGTEVNDMMDDVSHHQRYRTDEERNLAAHAGFAPVIHRLKVEAADLLYGDRASDRL